MPFLYFSPADTNAKATSRFQYAAPVVLAVLKMFFILFLGRGVPGEGPDSHFLEDIVGFGTIPARIRGFLIFSLALSTARLAPQDF